LLRSAKVKGPYVLAGHSYGGLLARAYAAQFPDEVAGVVLIDSTHEDSQLMVGDKKVVRLRKLAGDKPIPPVQRRLLAPKGGTPPGDGKGAGRRPTKLEAPYDRLPPEVQKLRLWARGRPHQPGMDFLAEEAKEMYAARAKAPHPLGDVPLVVLTRGREDYPAELPARTRAALTRDRLRLQADLVGLSRDGKQVIARRSGHEIHLDEPEVVVRAVREVVEAVRRHTRLPGAQNKGG
jgi:pimeloyl-ACP methyl ester carboxylesterase